MIQFLKAYFSRRERMAYLLPEFAHKHKDLLIIVADPKTDEIYIHYKDHLIRGNVGEKDNPKKQKIISTMLKFGRFPTVIDKFLLELQVALKGYNEKAKYFFIGVYDALYAIAKANTKGSKN